jgi:deoxyribose-phosphate aldolase
MKLFDEYRQTSSSIENRLKEVTVKYADEINGPDILPKILGVLDMTTLEGTDTESRVEDLCRQSIFSRILEKLPDAAAVCVYPTLVRKARRELEGTGVRVASVAGAFPSGQSSLQVKLLEVRFALEEGADEIDTVISRGKLLEGRHAEVLDELSAIREICSDKTLKIILETGELSSVELIRKASEIAILAGADFIKTSTGKIQAGASTGSFMVMMDTIREYLEKTGKSVGIKAAGGIKTTGQALAYASLLVSLMGDEYLDKNLFRIGASSLAGDLLKSILASDLPSDKKY